MPKQVFTAEKLLEILYDLYKLHNKGKIMAVDLEAIEERMKQLNIEISRRTIYRRLRELQSENLVQQTIEYSRKYQLKEFDDLQNYVIVDKNDKQIPKTEFGKLYNQKKAIVYILKEIGEIKLNYYELTEKAIKKLTLEE